MLLTGGFQIVLRDTMNFAAAVLTSVPCPSKMHKVPKQARDGGRVEPGSIDPGAALQVQKRSRLDQLFSLGKQAQRCLGLCYRSHSGTEGQRLELHFLQPGIKVCFEKHK